MISRLWRAIKREILLGDILAYEKRLETIYLDGPHHYDQAAIEELRGLLALARARLNSEEFNAAPAAQQGGV